MIMYNLVIMTYLRLFRYLCDRDFKAFSALFEMLEVQEHICYEDFNSLSSKIMNFGVHLPEVRSTFKR